jgi:hypothetical protein
MSQQGMFETKAFPSNSDFDNIFSFSVRSGDEISDSTHFSLLICFVFQSRGGQGNLD